MQLLDMSVASAGFAAIAIVSTGAGGVKLVAAPELGTLPQLDQVRLLISGAEALLNAARGLEARGRKS